MIRHELSGRDADIVQAVARFTQLAPTQLVELLFTNSTAYNSCNIALLRLIKLQYLYRVERRTVGGSRGGSGQYVYCLGREGWNREPPWRPARAVNYHALAVADTYLELVRLARMGVLHINGYLVEDEAYIKIGNFELRPDMYVDIQRHGVASNLTLFLEIDLGTEGRKRIKSKLDAYWGAYISEADSDIPFPQYIIFITVDEYRKKELKWFLSNETAELQALVRIMTMSEFAASFKQRTYLARLLSRAAINWY